MDFKQLNKQLDFIEFLDNHKIKYERLTGGEYMVKCPNHKGTKNKFAWNDALKVGHCFVCDFRADGLGFVQRYFGFSSMTDAVKTLELFVTDYHSVDNCIDSVLSDLASAKKFKSKVASWQGSLPEPTERNAALCQEYRYLEKSTIEKFGLVADEANKRIGIPMTYRGNLTGLQWYHTMKNAAGECYIFDKKGEQKIVRKYKIEHGTEKASFLYGFDQALQGVIEMGFVILVEGVFCTLSAHDKGYPNTVCSLGAKLSEQQAQHLLSLSPNIYICYDNDKAGRKGAFDAIIELGPTANVKLVSLPRGKDVYSLTKEEFEVCLDKGV